MLQSQGLLHDTYVYGVDAKQIVPTLLYPTELMDGAILVVTVYLHVIRIQHIIT